MWIERRSGNLLNLDHCSVIALEEDKQFDDYGNSRLAGYKVVAYDARTDTRYILYKSASRNNCSEFIKDLRDGLDSCVIEYDEELGRDSVLFYEDE